MEKEQWELEAYFRRIHVLEDAFERLQQASGLADLQSVVTGIIKTNEQHASLYSHMNTLLAEIDSLEDTLRRARGTMGRQRMLREVSEQQAQQIKEELIGQTEALTFSVAGKEKHLGSIKELLGSAFIAVQAVLEQFEAKEFQDIMVVKSHRDKRSSGDTILSRLSDLDACLASLLTWLAYLRGNSPRLLPKVPPSRSHDTLTPSVKMLLSAIHNSDIDPEDIRIPLKENDFRSRARLALDAQQSGSTLASRRRAQTPH